MKLSQAMGTELLNEVFETERAHKLLNVEVVKEFTMLDSGIWLSWKELGIHRNVKKWWLLKNGYAVGFNENPSLGWSFPVKKLSKEMFDKCKQHVQSYTQYYKFT